MSQGFELSEKQCCLFYKLVESKIFQDKKLKIPDKFIKNYGHELDLIATLIFPSGRVWLVQLKKDDRKVWFGDGWNEIIKYYSISIGHLLVFKYIGSARFKINVFDLKNSEIKYPCNATNSSEHDKERPIQNDKGVQCDWLELVNVVNEGLHNLNDEEKENKRRKLTAEPGNENRSECSKRRNLLLKDARESAFRAATRFMPVNPFFKITLKPSYVQKGLALLHIPCTFARKYLNGVSGFITLEGPQGKNWLVQCVNGDREVRLRKGWPEFIRDNNLTQGDVCVFELINVKDVVLKVTIFRILENAGNQH